MRKTDLEGILRTVEKIRKEKHPDLSPEFLEAVVRIEDENPEDDAAAVRGIQEAVEQVLPRKAST